jgi:predicted amidohydrolase
MARVLTVGAAQLGPIARNETRGQVVKRLIELMRQAKSMGADLVVYPELALTTFFPRWYFESQAEIDQWFEREMPSAETRPLFEEAKRLGVAFKLGYAELTEEAGRTRRFNTAILVDKDGAIKLKYRKIHLPGHAEHEPWRAFQHLEKRYFEVGNLGFPVTRMLGGILGMCICNDRRWPETYRVMGLQGVEMVCLGYNTPEHHPVAPEHDHLGYHHNTLSLQAGAYQNGTFVVGVAKAGLEENCKLIGGTQIVAPSGETIAMATTLGDELVVARCDLDHTKSYKETIFNFAKHRRPEAYRLICERTGAVLPPE